MDDRVTIMINPKVAKALRDLQAKQIKETSQTVSFSRVINEVVAAHLGLRLPKSARGKDL